MSDMDLKQQCRQIIDALQALANPDYAVHAQRYFKTGKGEYGEGDLFLGIRVPQIRKTVAKFKHAAPEVAAELLQSSYHEIRLFALLLLVHSFSRADSAEQTEIYKLYLSQTQFINNWDLVDSSAHKIVGRYLEQRDRAVLYTLAQSESLWERRIAIIATAHFIALRQYDDTLKLAGLLLHDSEDLIHKAVGWMLREVGKQNLEAEVGFLRQHCQQMPRTMLRYAIEKFSKEERLRYLSGTIAL